MKRCVAARNAATVGKASCRSICSREKRRMSVNGGARAERRSGLVLVLTSAVAFAIGPIAAKIALDNGSNVLTVVTLRGAIGAALLRAAGCRVSPGLSHQPRRTALVPPVRRVFCLDGLWDHRRGRDHTDQRRHSDLLRSSDCHRRHHPLARRRSIDRRQAGVGLDGARGPGAGVGADLRYARTERHRSGGARRDHRLRCHPVWRAGATIRHQYAGQLVCDRRLAPRCSR